MLSRSSGLIIIFVLLFIFGCENESQKQVKGEEEKIAEVNTDSVSSKKLADAGIQPGKIQTVKCLKDSSVQYSLYVPSSYKSSGSYPIIFMFDPQGDASLPVKKYTKLADEFNVILAASCNSKNGLAWDKIQPQLTVFMDDCNSKLSIDNKRIYTSGFSGGSRVASGLAISSDLIDGVIGCGGGLPGKSTNLGYPFDYYGIVGDEDFNLGEMRQLDQSMNNSGMSHYISEVQGGHNWPEVTEMRNALLWLQMSAMRKSILPKDQAKIDSLVVVARNEINQKKKSDNYEALIACKKWISMLKDLTSVEEFKTEGTTLFQSEAVKVKLSEQTITEEKEMELTRNFWTAFEKEDMKWWKSNYSNLLTMAQKAGKKEDRSMYKRLKGFLGLAAFSFSNSAIQQADYKKALKFLQIYELVEPNNSEHAYLHAKIYAASSNWQQAQKYFKKATDLGFNDSKRVEEEPVFSKAPDQKAFRIILSKSNNQ